MVAPRGNGRLCAAENDTLVECKPTEDSEQSSCVSVAHASAVQPLWAEKLDVPHWFWSKSDGDHAIVPVHPKHIADIQLDPEHSISMIVSYTGACYVHGSNAAPPSGVVRSRWHPFGASQLVSLSTDSRLIIQHVGSEVPQLPEIDLQVSLGFFTSHTCTFVSVVQITY